MFLHFGLCIDLSNELHRGDLWAGFFVLSQWSSLADRYERDVKLPQIFGKKAYKHISQNVSVFLLSLRLLLHSLQMKILRHRNSTD